MEGNKDEALRCVQIAKSAIASGDKQKALRFLKIAKRLNADISFDDLLASCDNLDSEKSKSPKEANGPDHSSKTTSSSSERRNGEDRAYTEEHVKLIREVKRNNDYYAILGVDKNCSVEEIRRAYKKLSLKVHPDKNKAPGSEEAFKKVCKAFKCLSEEESRRQYDQTGLVEDFEYNQQHNVRRRRRTRNDFYHDDFDPDEIFRSFFGRGDMFRNADVYRTRRRAEPAEREESQGGFNMIALIQLLPILVIFLLVSLPFSEPEYGLQRNAVYQFPHVTEDRGVEFFARSPDFDQKYPAGSSARTNIEAEVERDHRSMLERYCHVELQRRQWNRKYPTPHCDKLRNMGLA